MRLVACLAFTAIVLPASAQLSPSSMPKVGTVDARFQSYNIEMVEVVGGRFWKPYGSEAVKAPTATDGTPGIDPSLYEQRTPIDLSNPRLRMLASALGPVYVRVSGSWANTVYFHDADTPAPATPPTGFGATLTRAEWRGVIDFVHATDGKLVTSFSTGMGVRDKSALWQPAQAKAFIDYTHAIGGKIAAAEFMNEPTFTVAAGVPKDYDGAAYGRDFAVFQPFFRKAAPEALLLGPGSVGEGIDFVPMKLLPSTELLAGLGPNPVDVFSYHFYGAISSRCAVGPMGAKSGTSTDAALTEDWLTRSARVEAFYAKLRDTYAPGKPVWLTETGQTACGGDRWASTFLDTFRYLDQLGTLARANVQVVMHNTLAASDYGLIDEKTLIPRPNYWAALLWHRTMGATVLDPGPSPAPTVHLFAHCTAGLPGSVTLLAINLDRTATQSLTLPMRSTRYTLTSANLLSHSVQLNEHTLILTSSGRLPILTGLPAPAGQLILPAASITFFDIPAGNPACK